MTSRPVIEVRVDDPAFVEVEALVRPATAMLGAITPLVRRLEIAAGPRLPELLRLQEPLPVGSAVVTGAGDLAAELLIHGVIQSDEDPVTPAGVRRALRSALQRIGDWQLRTVALVPFGLGAGNLDLEESAAATAEVIAEHLATGPAFPTALTIVTETADETDIFRHSLGYRGL